MRNCIRCGAEIDLERLEFLPDTVTCVACSRIPAKATLCDPADGEVVLLEDGEAARRARGLPRPPAVPAGCRRAVTGLVPAGGVLGPR